MLRRVVLTAQREKASHRALHNERCALEIGVEGAYAGSTHDGLDLDSYADQKEVLEPVPSCSLNCAEQ